MIKCNANKPIDECTLDSDKKLALIIIRILFGIFDEGDNKFFTKEFGLNFLNDIKKVLNENKIKVSKTEYFNPTTADLMNKL